MELLAPSITGTPTTQGKDGAPPVAARLFFIDNLRWLMILLVISQHASATYSNLGKWYYNEPTALGRPEQAFFVTYEFFLQTFFMGILFFVAGYFVPGAVDRKGVRRFLKDRAFRLGCPTLLYMFVLAPLTGFFGGYRRSAGAPLHTFLHEYKQYITSFQFFLGTGPLWFCVALLFFSCVYAGWRLLVPSKPASHSSPFPRNGILIAFITAIALASFIVRLSWPVGTASYNMQFCYFSQYIAFFIAGTLAYRHSWLTTIKTSTGKAWGNIGLFGGLVSWFALVILGGGLNGHAADYNGGWHWQSLALSFLEAMAGVGISLGCITLLRDRYNRQGPRSAFFSTNAFAVYVFHAPILILICRAMAGWHGEAISKFLVAALLATAASFTLSAAVFRRIPVLKNIL